MCKRASIAEEQNGLRVCRGYGYRSDHLERRCGNDLFGAVLAGNRRATVQVTAIRLTVRLVRPMPVTVLVMARVCALKVPRMARIVPPFAMLARGFTGVKAELTSEHARILRGAGPRPAAASQAASFGCGYAALWGGQSWPGVSLGTPFQAAKAGWKPAAGRMPAYKFQAGCHCIARASIIMRPAFYAFSAASLSSTLTALVRLSTPKTTSARADPGSNPQ